MTSSAQTAEAESSRLNASRITLASFMRELLAQRGDDPRQKKGCLGTLFGTVYGLLAVALTELVDLFGGLQNMLLAGVKRMRLA